jgi:hypothetical protein
LGRQATRGMAGRLWICHSDQSFRASSFASALPSATCLYVQSTYPQKNLCAFVVKSRVYNSCALCYKVVMESNWAVEHLQVIRTLMERSALYRRALAPIMTFNGVLGIAGAATGWALNLNSPRTFIVFWAGICVLAILGSLLMARRQALRDAEPFWSPPTRRVCAAFLPPLTVGFILTLIVFVNARDDAPASLRVYWLAAAWVVLYGCALHSAGFFMPRGARWFGWGFVLAGSGLFFTTHFPAGAQVVMGIFFGVLHLAYGGYLYFTEKRTDSA